MSPLDKLIISLNKQKIVFSPTDGDLNNIILKRGDQELKIHHKMFYRKSGICAIHKEKEQNMIEVVFVDDEMFYGSYMKSIIDFHFK